MEYDDGSRKMRNFLRHELATSLLSRATERVRELPLALNENQQYIHYNKGSVVFYALRDAIGEDTFNRILSGFLDKWAFKGPPYPTTRNFLADLYAGTDEKYHPLIRDMFERIVFFDNRPVEATATQRPAGKYALTLEVAPANTGRGAVRERRVEE